MTPARCYLVAHIDVTVMPPVLRGFGIYSEDAGSVTCSQRRAFPLDVFLTEEGGRFGRGYDGALKAMLAELADTRRLGGSEALRLMALDAVANPIEVVDPEPLGRDPAPPGGAASWSDEQILVDRLTSRDVVHDAAQVYWAAREEVDDHGRAIGETLRVAARMALEAVDPERIRDRPVWGRMAAIGHRALRLIRQGLDERAALDAASVVLSQETDLVDARQRYRGRFRGSRVGAVEVLEQLRERTPLVRGAAATEELLTAFADAAATAAADDPDAYEEVTRLIEAARAFRKARLASETADVERALTAGWLLEEAFRLDRIGVVEDDDNAVARGCALLNAAHAILLGKHATSTRNIPSPEAPKPAAISAGNAPGLQETGTNYSEIIPTQRRRGRRPKGSP